MKHLILSLFTLHFSLFTLHAASVEILPGPFADVRGNLVVETIPFDAAIDKPIRWVFEDSGKIRPERIVKCLDLTTLALYPTSPVTNFVAYIDADGSGSYTPGEPFGVSNLRDTPAIELTDMSAITQRLNLWNNDVGTASDRSVVFGPGEVSDGTLFDPVTPAGKTLVTVSRYRVDGRALFGLGKGNHGIIISKMFESTSRDYLHEGDFLADGKIDIDWDHLYEDIVSNEGVQMYGCVTTNISYLVTFDWDPNYYLERDDAPIRANATLVTRRFEKTRTVPTPVSAFIHSTTTTTNYNFKFRIDNEDPWASWFGTTYTAFKVKVLNGSTEVWNSGIQRLPPRDKNGVYTFSTPTNYQLTSANSSLTWRVAVYNAKFKTDTIMYVDFWGLHEGDPFSPAQPITDEPPPQSDDPSGTVDIAIYPGPNASNSGPIIIEQERNPFRYRTPQKWTIPDCILRRPPVFTRRVFCANTNAPFVAYIDADASGSYTPGEPFGVSNGRDTPQIELSDMSAITPRVNLWSGECDRSTWTGTNWLNIGSALYDRFEKTTATYPKCRVRVVRYSVDNFPVYKVGVNAIVVFEKDFCETSRDFLHEGDFLADGDLDIDWKNLYSDVVDWRGVQAGSPYVTNVTYLIVYNWDKSEYVSDKDTNTQVKANATLVTRRFERTRTVPTPVSAFIHSTTTTTNYNFKFRIDNEDPWASWFGTTYTAFKVKVLNGSTEVWNSGVLRLPSRDKNGIYTANFSNISNLSNVSNLSYRVAVYNAKFKTDTLMAMETEGDPFSPAQPITIIGD